MCDGGDLADRLQYPARHNPTDDDAEEKEEPYGEEGESGNLVEDDLVVDRLDGADLHLPVGGQDDHLARLEEDTATLPEMGHHRVGAETPLNGQVHQPEEGAAQPEDESRVLD
jgi:hypothetical protein